MDTINDAISFVTSAGPELATVILIIAFGYSVRLMPFCPNRIIPLFVIVFGTVAYCLLKENGEVPPNMHNPLVWKIVMGFIISVFVWTFHYAILKRLEDKFLPKSVKDALDSTSGDAGANTSNSVPKTP